MTVQKNLYALKDFLDKNPHLFHSSPGDPAAARTAGGSEQEAWRVRVIALDRSFAHGVYPQVEQTSVAHLQSLLARTIEGLSFVLLLNDYRLGELIAR